MNLWRFWYKTIRNARGFFIAKITTIIAGQQGETSDTMNRVYTSLILERRQNYINHKRDVVEMCARGETHEV